MKNLYHLFVTRYKLHVTSYKSSLSDIGYRISFIAFCILHSAFCFFPAAAFAQKQATITNVDFSCPEGTIEVTYDLAVCEFSVDVTLYYSSDKCKWGEAFTVSGDLISQTTGTNKKITWDAAEDHVTFGKFYYKVEYTLPHPPEPNFVLISGVKWSPVNLDFGGWFCENPWDVGGFYQWGRRADGHECNSPTIPTINIQSSTDDPGHSLFIRHGTNWRNPINNYLWNSGTEANPVKTANDPCPDGWRVPTETELSTLITGNISKSWTSQNGINGYLFKNVPDDDNSLFFPDVKYRSGSSGSIVVTITAYWGSSNTSVGSQAFQFRYDPSPLSNVYRMSNSNRSNGCSVRCVSEN